MRLVSVELQNYGPFVGAHLFPLGRQGMVHIEGRNQDEPWLQSNGAGKSTVLDGLDWTLFGVVPRGDHVDSIVNDEAGCDTVGIVRLIDDERGDTSISIMRWRKHREWGTNGVRFRVGKDDWTTLDARETQAQINEILGLDRKLFHAAVLYGQEDRTRFADATDKERMDILTHILQLEELDEWADLIKKDRSRATDEVARCAYERAAAEARLEGTRSTDPQAQHDVFEQRRRAERAEFLEQQRQAQGRVLELQELLAKVGPIDESLIGDLNSQVRAANQAYGEMLQLSGQHTQALREIDNAGRSYAALQSAVCPTCRQQVAPDHVGMLHTGLEAQRVEVQAALDAVSLRSKQWGEHVSGLQAALEFQNQRALTVAQGDIQLLAANQQWARLDQSVAECEQRVNPYTNALVAHATKLAEAQEALDLAVKDLVDANRDLAYYDFWTAALRASGLKNHILDSRLWELNAAINEWTDVMTMGAVKVRLDSQTDKRTGGKANKLSIIVQRSNADGSITNRNYVSWSGGEKQRVSLAIDFGLSRIVARRASKRYDVMILDELFRHLDALGRRYCMDMLTQLAKEKSSVFVVDHDAEFASQFSSRWLVERKGLRSVVHFGGGHESTRAARQELIPVGSLPVQRSESREVRAHG